LKIKSVSGVNSTRNTAKINATAKALYLRSWISVFSFFSFDHAMKNNPSIKIEVESSLKKILFSV
jgi:hypothetical protein